MEHQTFSVGSRVRVKQGIKPSGGWGYVQADECGIVTKVGIRGNADLIVNFPSQCNWKARSCEMEHSDSDARYEDRGASQLAELAQVEKKLQCTQGELFEVKSELADARAEIARLKKERDGFKASAMNDSDSAGQFSDGDSIAHAWALGKTQSEKESTTAELAKTIPEVSTIKDRKASVEAAERIPEDSTFQDKKALDECAKMKDEAAYNKGDKIVLLQEMKINGQDCPVGKEGQVHDVDANGMRINFKGAGRLHLEPNDPRLSNIKLKSSS